jgi:FKBP-type peptidyl-prolyl cis-trans isomerase
VQHYKSVGDNKTELNAATDVWGDCSVVNIAKLTLCIHRLVQIWTVCCLMLSFIYAPNYATSMALGNPTGNAPSSCSRRRATSLILAAFTTSAHVALVAAALPVSLLVPEPANAAVKVADKDAGRNVVTTRSGLKYYDFIAGTGDALVGPGSTVTFHYAFGTTGARNGWKIDSTHDRSPLTVTTGTGQVIAGLDECLCGMRPGGRRRCLIPSALGYTSTKDNPSPPGFAEYQRFKNLYLNKDRPYQPDAVFDIDVLRVAR